MYLIIIFQEIKFPVGQVRFDKKIVAECRFLDTPVLDYLKITSESCFSFFYTELIKNSFALFC